MILTEENYLAHYGILRKSGRYPWGSGETQSVRNKSFLDAVDGLRKQGLSEAKIAEGFGLTTTQLRASKTIALNQVKQEKIAQAQRLKDKGYSNSAIGRRMGLNESSVRALLAPGEKVKVDILQSTANMLKDQVEKKDYIDVGAGVENHLGISYTKLKTAVAMLQEEGYKVHYVKVQQLGTGKMTTIKVLSKPDVPYSEVFRNRGNIKQLKQVTEFSNDGGKTYMGIKPPMSISSKRIDVKYKEDGGADADGVVYVRPGVKDLSLGSARYAQVRIAVDGTHYIKGMAMYRDDLPKGTDLVFNTSKSKTSNKLDAMKPMKDDPDNPFGAMISHQILAKDKDGNDRVTSAMNIVNEEGDWMKWSKSLASQMLSKQDPHLAKTQLDMTHERRVQDLDDIVKLTNPVVRRKLLETYADSTDSAAVHLRAAALPRQASHVILPVPSMKETEIYAPNYRNGERVVLIRYPHGGTFEIPQLRVNNRHPDAKKMIGVQAKDAVGIHPKVAERLSGADFDGDTVLVIPNNKGLVKRTDALQGLKDFDPRRAFPPYDGMKTIDGGTYNAKTNEVDYPKNASGHPIIRKATKQQEMGKVTNLITDMTIHGANNEELARAVRHSMVVIDAEKHSLDYRASAKVNGITQLKSKYQGGPRAGAKTLISRAGSPVYVPNRIPRPMAEGGPVNPKTGEKVWKYTGEFYINKAGKRVEKSTKSTQLAEAKDAFSLVSGTHGTQIERVYAEHANKLKALANTARKEAVATKPIKYSPSSKAIYANEVESLNAKLNLALKNRPLERQAQVIANTVVSLKRQANPEMDFEDLQKVKAQALTTARSRTKAGKHVIIPTQAEWDAIQAGAISTNKLTQIINNSDLDTLKKLATPRAEPLMTSTKRVRAAAMLDAGYTQAEVADALGVSLSTLKASISK